MKQLCVLLSFILLVQIMPPVRARAAGTRASLLIEASSGCILSEENADEPLPVGSLAKLMTAYLTAQAIGVGVLSADTVLTAGQSVTGMQGAVIWLEPGDTITVEELLLGLLVGNANDAAAVLADAVSGDAAHFVMDMNAAAFDLGMRSTRFTSPQGFDDPEAHSTARDMGLLACAVLRCAVLTPYLTVWRTFIREESVELVNENTLTRTLEGCRGLKAAHSPDAGQCLIAACEQDGMVCAAVVLGCEDEDERFASAKALLADAFRSYRLTIPGFSEEFLRPLRIKGGTESAVLLHLPEQPLLAVPQGAQLQAVTVLPEFMQAPVEQGQRVGTVYFYHGDTLLSEAPLLAGNDVPEMTFRSALAEVLRYLFM